MSFRIFTLTPGLHREGEFSKGRIDQNLETVFGNVKKNNSSLESDRDWFYRS